jgi:hypothetical protein
MGKFEKLRERILSGTSDTNIEFKLLCNLVTRLGFSERIKGDHHIFTKSGVEEIMNLQPIGTKAKPYQVRQVRNLIIKYHLGDQDVD